MTAASEGLGVRSAAFARLASVGALDRRDDPIIDDFGDLGIRNQEQLESLIPFRRLMLDQRDIHFAALGAGSECDHTLPGLIVPARFAVPSKVP